MHCIRPISAQMSTSTCTTRKKNADAKNNNIKRSPQQKKADEKKKNMHENVFTLLTLLRTTEAYLLLARWKSSLSTYIINLIKRYALSLCHTLSLAPFILLNGDFIYFTFECVAGVNECVSVLVASVAMRLANKSYFPDIPK